MNRLSVFYHHVLQSAKEQELSIEEIFGQLREQGYSCVDIDADDIGDIAKLKQALRAQETGVSSIYFMYDWKERADSEINLRRMELAQELEAIRFMPVPGLYTASKEDIAGRREELLRAVEVEAGLVDLASDRGLTVSMEDFDNEKSPIATIEGMSAFLDEIPKLTVALDTGNFCFSGQDVLEAFELFRGRISHVHLKDRKIRREPSPHAMKSADGRFLYPCPVGCGDIPIETIMEGLRQDGFDGVYSCEFFGVSDYTEAIRRSAAWVRGKLYNGR